MLSHPEVERLSLLALSAARWMLLNSKQTLAVISMAAVGFGPVRLSILPGGGLRDNGLSPVLDGGLVSFARGWFPRGLEWPSAQNPGFDWLTTNHVFRQDPLDALRCHAPIDDPFGPDQQNWTLGADAQAIGLGTQHYSLGPGRILQLPLPHQAFKFVPAGGADGWIGTAERLGGGGAEQQVVTDLWHLCFSDGHDETLCQFFTG